MNGKCLLWRGLEQPLFTMFVLALCFAGCAGRHECVVGDMACDGGTLLRCFRENGKAEVGGSDSEIWHPIEGCGSASLCITPAVPNSSQSESLCSITEAPQTGCDPNVRDTTTCASGMFTYCIYGYPQVTLQCGRCDVGPDGGAECRGFIGDSCASVADCAPNLECQTLPDAGTSQVCTSSCQVDSDCSPVTGTTVGSNGPEPFHGWWNTGTNRCVNGWCQLTP